MPVKSSTSSVLVWPKKADVVRAVESWAAATRSGHSGIVGIGYYGSLRRDDWGVGSDVDLVVVVESSRRRAIERPLDFDLSSIPVPADLLVFTAEEWGALERRKDRFAREMRDVVWL
ncbi:MAG: nucleotidyltransferase domain-containing protein [Acidobacteria bacterium]|nr:nucleotidyltransferase domain-containing protein [Acidobacteriota bacterium]